jgi:hypothetical protein
VIWDRAVSHASGSAARDGLQVSVAIGWSDLRPASSHRMGGPVLWRPTKAAPASGNLGVQERALPSLGWCDRHLDQPDRFVTECRTDTSRPMCRMVVAVVQGAVLAVELL